MIIGYSGYVSPQLGGEGEQNLRYDLSQSQWSYDNEKIFNDLQKDMGRMTSFVSDLGNKQAMDVIEKLKMPKVNIDEKLNSLEWLVKNIRFINDNLVSTCVKVCQDIHKKGRQNEEYVILFKTKHTSPINSTIKKSLSEITNSREIETYSRLVHNLMDLLEI